MTYPYLTVDPIHAWPCATFGDDTDGNKIWDKFDSVNDLIKGDGSTAGTFPTFTSESEEIEYYEFDGVDDYVSNWPDMPAAYTVSAALSDSHPDGQPYISQCNDATVKNLLTVGGAFTGNLHNLVIFDSVLSAEEALAWADYQLRRVWRDTLINPYTARLIRNGEDVQEYVFSDVAAPYTDWSDTGATATPTGITWSNGLTYDNSSSVVTVPDEAAVRSDPVSIFASGVFDTGHIVDKGTNYEVSAVYAAGNVTITANGVSSGAIACANLYSIGVVLEDGEYPMFYVNGYYKAVGGSTTTVNDTDTNDLLIGNQAGGSSEFTGTLKRLTIVNRALEDTEIGMLHLAAMADF